MTPVLPRLINALAIASTTLMAACAAATTTADTNPNTGAGLATPPSQKPDITKAAIVGALERAALSQGIGGPALWTCADEDTTIYLFGTLPFLEPESDWRTPAFDAALETAEAIILEAETLSPSAEAKTQRIINDNGLYRDGRLLSDVLTEPVELRLRGAAARLGIPYAALESFKPWLVARQLNRTATLSNGLQYGSEIERVLTEEGRAEGKSIAFLGDVSDTLNRLSSLPAAAQMDRLTLAAITTELIPHPQSIIVDEWLDGDVAGLSTLTANPAFHGGQETFAQTIVSPSRDYAAALRTHLDDPGIKLAVIDIAHLLGPDGVLALLESEGITVTGPGL